MLAVQCKVARTDLALDVRDLPAAAGVSADTVAPFERGEALKERTVSALQASLEAAGVFCTNQNGEGPSVRLERDGRAS